MSFIMAISRAKVDLSAAAQPVQGKLSIVTACDNTVERKVVSDRRFSREDGKP
jgi:hypothetical protein